MSIGDFAFLFGYVFGVVFVLYLDKDDYERGWREAKVYFRAFPEELTKGGEEAK